MPSLARVVGVFRFSVVLTVVTLCAATHAFAATVTSLADDGPGTLRQAVAAASPGDTIDFAVSGILTLSSVVVIDKDLTIDGPGAAALAIDGAGSTQILQVNAGATVTMSGLTLRHGATALHGGAVFNSGALTLDHAVVSNSVAGVNGGGIFNDGALTLDQSVVSDNVAGSNAGAIFGARNGSLTLLDTVVAGNYAGSSGGAIVLGPAVLIANASTIANNSSAFRGGGIFASRASSIALNNVTIAGNDSVGDGGGIFSSVPVTLNHVTLTNNAAGAAGGGLHQSAALSIKNSIVAGNRRSGGIVENCVVSAAPSVTSHGHNLLDDGTCGLSDATDIFVSSAQVGLDPLGLQDNGGPTSTIALLAGSVGVDAVPAADCTAIDGTPIATDQRGVARPQGAGCDVGAFELLSVEALLHGVVGLVDALDAGGGTVNSLLAKLNSALAKLGDANVQNDGAAVNSLQAFINAVEAQRGKKIPDADADALIVATQQVIALIEG